MAYFWDIKWGGGQIVGKLSGSYRRCGGDSARQLSRRDLRSRRESTVMVRFLFEYSCTMMSLIIMESLQELAKHETE